MEAVGKLYHYHPHIGGDGKDKLLEVFCLLRNRFVEDVARDFRKSVDNVCYCLAEHIGDVFDREVGIFDHIVHQGGTYRGRPEPHLFDAYLCHSQRVQYIRFARTTFDSFVGFGSKLECLCYDFEFMFVVRRPVGFLQVVERLEHHLVFFFFGIYVHIDTAFVIVYAKIVKIFVAG